jgi:hypothetical protein
MINLSLFWSLISSSLCCNEIISSYFFFSLFVLDKMKYDSAERSCKRKVRELLAEVFKVIYKTKMD